MKKQISNLFTKATTQPPTSVADRLLIGCSSVADRLLTMTSLCHHLVHRTLSLRTLRVAASLTLLLCLGVGQMWGAESATNNPATVSYGTGGAAKTFLNVANTVSNCTISSGSVACVTYGLYEMDKNWKPAFYSGPANGSSSSYDYTSASTYGFMAGSSAGTGTAANKSATSGYGAAKYTSSAGAVIYVTGITGIAVMGKDNNTSSEKRLYIKVEEYAANGTCTAVGTGDGITKSSYNKSLHITTFDAGTLSGTAYYKVTLTSGNTSNCETSQIRFTKYIAAGTTHSVSAVTSTGTNTYGSVSAGSTTVVEGGTTTITATPAAGYRVTNWAVSGTGASISPSGASNSNTTTLTMGTANATVTVTFGAIPTHTITYTNTKSMDNSANPTSYYEGVGVASFTKLRHAVGYDFTGWSPSSISSSATTNQTIDAQWTARAAAAGTGTLTYALAFAASTVTTSSITRNNGALYDATDVSVAHTSFSDGAVKNGCSGKLTTTSSKSATNYVELTFKIADGYTFTPTEVSVRANAVSTNKTLEVELKDNAATPNSKSVTGALAQGSTSGGSTVTLDFDASGEVALEGTVTAKIFVYGATDAWRLGTSIVITGTVASAAPSCTAPTTTFGNGEYTVGGSALDLSTLIGSNNSSGAITYTVKNANGTGASISTASFTATTAGTCTVTATQAANGDKCEKVMDATITVSAPPACSAPSAPTISSSESQTAFTAGESIFLSANCASGSDASTTFAWYKGSTWASAYAAGAIQAAEITENYGDYFMKSARVSDAGTYWCEASNGSGCEAHNTTGFTITVSKADISVTSGTGSASSITATGATLPFTLSGTTGVGSVTIKVYNNSTDALVKTVSGITATTSGSQAVTGLSANTTYYYKVTPIGDANHNDGSESSKSSTFTTLNQTWTVTYDDGGKDGGGAAPTDASSPYSAGASVTVLGNVNSMTKTGHTFRGWTDGTTFYRAGDTFTITANMTLTAVWDGGTSCTEYEVLLSNGSVTQESSTKPYGQYITGRGKIMRKGDGSDVTDLTTDGSCHSSTKYFQTGSGVIGLQTYNAINKVTVYAIATGGRTLSSIKTGTTLGTYGDDIQGDCEVIINGETDSPTSHITWSKNVCGEIEITFPNTLAANSYILITFSGNLYVYGAKFENCVVSNFTVSFANQTGFAGSTTLPGNIVGVPTGKKVLQPSNPTAAGYTFGGWYSNAACTAGNEIDWDEMTITADKTLYAKWTEKLTPAGTSLSATASSVCSGSSTTLTLNASTSGVEYELYEGGVKLRSVTGTGSALSMGATSNLTSAKTYTVKSVENDDYKGMTLSGATTTVSIKTATSVSFDSYSKAAVAGQAYEITGISAAGAGDLSYQWYSYTSSGGAGEDDIDGATSSTYTFTPAAAGDYYFKCQVTGDCGSVKSDMITVTASNLYDINMGSHTNGSFTIKVGSASAVSTNTESGAGATIAIVATPSSGYVFKKWEILKDADDSDITTTVGATATSASTSFTMPSYDVTINAVFVATHTLTVSVSGGVGGTVSPTSTTVGETLTQSISASPSTGYNFTSWAVSGTGSTLSSTTANPTTFTMGTENATVTATFSARTYSVSLDRGIGSSGSNSVTMTYNSSSHTAITAPTAPTGYSFAGWYTGSGGTGSMVMNASGVLQAGVTNYTGAGGIWTRTTSTTLYAKYTANYPDGYLYITDVMATPETKAGYTITASATDAAYDGALDGGFSHSGLQHWAKASAKNTGVYTLTFSSALSASATAAGVAVDVWWGSDNGSSNAGTRVYINGTADSDEIGYQKTDSKTRQQLLEGLKNLPAVGTTSVSSLQLKCTDNAGSTWFRVGIKEIPGYLLTYDAGSGSGAPSAEYKPNATITLSNTEPTWAGHVFLGWQVDGSGTVYAAGASFDMPASATTLVAKWEAVCMSFAAATSGSSDVSEKTEKVISTSSGGYASTLSGGSMTFYGRLGTIGNNDTYGLVFDSKDDELLTVTLTDAMFEAGTVILLDCYSVNKSSKEIGFTVSGNACAEGNYTTTAAAYQRFTRTYEVTAEDGIAGTNSFVLEGATTDKIYLKGMQIAGCGSCTGINPTLTYSATTLYLEPETITASPTLNKDGSTGTVTYSSSNTSVATVNSLTGVVTPVAAGTATIRAHIAYDETHCPTTATCNITVVTCGVMPVASAVLTSNSAADEYNATAVISGLSGSQKLNEDGAKFGMTVTGDSPFKDGDIINITGTMDADPTTTTFAVYSSSTASSSSLIYTTTLSAGAAINVEIEVTGDILTALNTSKTVAVIRTKSPSAGQYNQNPHMSGIYLKRYSCSDGMAEFTGEGEDALWSNTDNWTGGKLPTTTDRAIVKKPVIVNVTTAVAKEVFLMQNSTNTGKLTVDVNGALIVDGTIQLYDGSLKATTVNDVVINTDEDGQGALIFDNPSGALQTKGTVNMYTKSSRIDGKLQWQYVGLPFTTATDEIYGGLYVNRYSETAGSWTVMRYQDDRTINAWEGLAISGDDAGYACMQGTFVPTGTKTISLTYNNPGGKGKNLIGNSWTAPIQIAEMEESDFGGARATVYIFNTGRYNPAESEGSVDGSGTDNKTAGVWVTIPIEAAKTAMAAETWGSLKVIPAYQGFQVKTAATSAKTLTLDYDKHVRPATNTTNEALRAPIRRTADDVKFMRLSIESNKAKQTVYLFESNRFSDDFDNGWDGDYMGISGQDAYLYIVSPTLGKLAVSAQNDLEGSILGVQSGAQDEYVFTFAGDGMGYYLNDLKTQESTLIEEGNTYTFTYEKGDAANRFMISATPFAKTNPTGVDKVQGDKVQSDKVRKVLIDDHLYIIRAGKMFNATGGRVR